MNSNLSWVSPTYDAVALLGAALSMYVMQMTEHDRINRIDAAGVQWARRLAFVIVALALCYSIVDQSWTPSLPVLGLVSAGVVNLFINALALHGRVPPTNSVGMRNRAHQHLGRSRVMAALRRMHL